MPIQFQMIRIGISIAMCACMIAGVHAAPASAAFTVEFGQQLFDDDGNPEMSAHAGSSGKVTYSWSKCEPALPCQPVADADGDDVWFRAGLTPPGTIFEVTARRGADVAVARSKTWTGQVTLVDPPRFSVPPAVGSLLYPVAARWSGGWPDDYDVVRVQGCINPGGLDCTTTWAPDEDYLYSNLRARLGPFYVGFRMVAVSTRYPADAAFAGVGHSAAEGVKPLVRNRTTAFSADYFIPWQWSPGVRTSRFASVRRGRFKLARVRCPQTCSVTYSGFVRTSSRSWEQIDGKLKVSGRGVIRVRVPRSAVGHVAQVAIWIDRGFAGSSRTRLRR